MNWRTAHCGLALVGSPAEEDVDAAVAQLRSAVEKLRELSPLWDMFKDGVDLSSIEWAAH